MAASCQKSLRRFCLACQGNSTRAVAACQDLACPLHENRLAQGQPLSKEQARKVLRSIRRYCLNCAGDRGAVRICAAKADCALWSYRFGVSPSTYRRVINRVKTKRSLLRLPWLSSSD